MCLYRSLVDSLVTEFMHDHDHNGMEYMDGVQQCKLVNTFKISQWWKWYVPLAAVEEEGYRGDSLELSDQNEILLHCRVS